MTHEEALARLLEMDDETLKNTTFILPSIIYPERGVDADGFPLSSSETKQAEDPNSRTTLQDECWRKFHRNPQINTSVRGATGRIVGRGFEATSEIEEIQDAIMNIEYDWRNRLYHYWRGFVGRAFVEGELFLVLTVHKDGFVEVDFLDPSALLPEGDEETGIVFHPRKKLLPLCYIVSTGDGVDEKEFIPSVYVARNPDMLDAIQKPDDFDTKIANSKSDDPKFTAIGGYQRFVLSWDRSFVTRRALSYLRTTIEWLNYYEDLKRYEIDHKKSAGAFVWAFTFESLKDFKVWAKMSEEERKATAIMQPLGPGSKIFVPPGMKLVAVNPNLPNISNSDTDIMQMVVSGLNESSDVTTGTVGGTYASVKATRGPMSDRTADEVEYFDRFYVHDFWGTVFFLMNKVSGFPAFFEREEVVAFGPGGKEIVKKKKYRPEFLVETSYPVSDTIDLQDRVKGLLGSKHGPLTESVGLPPSVISKWIGVGSYGRNRLRKATQDMHYPPLVYQFDSNEIESKQEKVEGEKGKDGNEDK